MNVIQAARKLKAKGGVIRQKGWGPEQYIECPDKTYYLFWTNGVQSARATPKIDDLLAEYVWSPAAPKVKPMKPTPLTIMLTPTEYRKVAKVGGLKKVLNRATKTLRFETPLEFERRVGLAPKPKGRR